MFSLSLRLLYHSPATQSAPRLVPQAWAQPLACLSSALVLLLHTRTLPLMLQAPSSIYFLYSWTPLFVLLSTVLTPITKDPGSAFMVSKFRPHNCCSPLGSASRAPSPALSLFLHIRALPSGPLSSALSRWRHTEAPPPTCQRSSPSAHRSFQQSSGCTRPAVNFTG